MRKDPGETTQAIDDIVWENCDENRNGRTETELIADCHGGNEVNLVTVLGFYSMFGSLESLLNLVQKHEMVTTISVEVFAGVLQTEQRYSGRWRGAIEAELNFRHSEIYRGPTGARYLVGSALASMCKSRYPVHFVAVDVQSTRTIVDQAFSMPKFVRLARKSEKSYELLCKMFSAFPERTREELELILGKKFTGYASGNFSDFEKQKGSTVTHYNEVDENDEAHQKTTDAMVQSPYDCMVIRVCQEAYVEAQHSVQCLSAGHWSMSNS